MGRCALAIAVAGALVLGLAGPAAAREARVTVATPPGPGPADFNRVWVDKYGPKNGKAVLVLMPGTIAGSGDFTLAARYLVKHVDGLQVWAIDRRSQALEDTTVFAQTLRGEKSLQEMFDYYLGYLDGATPPTNHTFVNGLAHPYARQWGMQVALEDARAVVRQARAKGKRKVILGGHSLGASLTTAYAAWDFNGRPGLQGHRRHGRDRRRPAGQLRLARLAGRDPGRLPRPQRAATPSPTCSASASPRSRGSSPRSAASTRGWRRTPRPRRCRASACCRPSSTRPFPVTTQGLLAYAFDQDTSPDNLSLIHINSGTLAPAGDPRPWQDGGVSPVARLAATFGQEPANGVEWYFPRRLTIDTDAASAMDPDRVRQLPRPAPVPHRQDRRPRST